MFLSISANRINTRVLICYGRLVLGAVLNCKIHITFTALQQGVLSQPLAQTVYLLANNTSVRVDQTLPLFFS